MNELALGIGGALWLGILTSISPCPLATNIAAISYLSKTILHVRLVVLAGAAYTMGRMIAYALVGYLIIVSMLGIPAVAQFLQTHMNRILGPVLIVAGLVLLDLLTFRLSGFIPSQSSQERLARVGVVLGPLALGFLFALSFCPVSAGLFFGSLIPLSLAHPGGTLLPLVYGFGTALPVIVFAVLVAFGVQSLSHWIRQIQRAEVYGRKITGGLFILVGAYYIWNYWL